MFHGYVRYKHIYIYPGWWFGTWLDYDFRYIGNVIIPTDDSSYFRGVAQPPTSYKFINLLYESLWHYDSTITVPILASKIRTNCPTIMTMPPLRINTLSNLFFIGSLPFGTNYIGGLGGIYCIYNIRGGDCLDELAGAYCENHNSHEAAG